jgi:anti-anti-sigma factor
VQTLAHRMVVVSLAGDVDGDCLLSTRILDVHCLPPHTLVHFDATRVEFIDSSGLSVLVTSASEVRQRGGFVSMRASDPVRRVVELCRLGPSLGLPALLPGAAPRRNVGSRRPIARGPVSRDRRSSTSDASGPTEPVEEAGRALHALGGIQALRRDVRPASGLAL